MSSKRSDRKIIIVLLLALFTEVFVLAFDLYRVDSKSHHGKIAGYIISKENKFLRRGDESLIWDSAQKGDELFYNDSVMTLSQSQAHIYLQEKTEVTLSENTLVLIESAEADSKNEIHLKLSRGDLSARNPYARTRIDHTDWNLNLEKGSDVDIRETLNGQFQIQVKAGEVQLNGQQKINKDQVIEINGAAVQSIQNISREFSWEKSLAKRIYTRDDQTEYQIRWQGNAIKIRIDQQEIDSQAAQSLKVKLPIGKHLIQAKTGDGVSLVLAVEVWRAPLFHLIEPLPRTRIRTHADQQFLWQTLAPASKYKIQFTKNDGTPFFEKETLESSELVKFETEEDLQWQVKAYDKDGYEIPAPYSYPLFLRHEPFAAPKIKQPMLRLPADGKSSQLSPLQNIFLKLVIPEASAEGKNNEAIFSWETVDGAHYYIIEISVTPDFRFLVVNQKTESNRFSWPQVKMQKYYWRVSAGAEDGRIGLFSDPMLVDFENFNEKELLDRGVSLTDVESKTQIKKIIRERAIAKVVAPTPPPNEVPIAVAALPKPVPTPLPTPLPLPKPAPTTELMPQPIPQSFSEEYRLSWTPEYMFSAIASPDNFTSKITGFVPLSVELERNAELFWRIHYSQAKFTPDPATKYPFQADLNVNEIYLQIGKNNLYQDHAWGFELKKADWFERTGEEFIQTRSDIRAGLVLQAADIGTHLLVGSFTQELGLDYKKTFSLNHFFYGLGIEGSLVSEKAKLSEVLKLRLIFGFCSKP